MTTRITATFEASPEETARAVAALVRHVRAESGDGAARALASALGEAALDEIPTGSATRPWYCSSCGDTHDATTPAVHRATARASHDGAALEVDVYGCDAYSPRRRRAPTLRRAAAATARELLTELRGGA